MIVFRKWEAAQEAGYYTKTQLSQMKPGRKPINDDCPKALYKKMREFDLFHIDETIEKKQNTVEQLEINDENIAKSLYIINKSAKKSRETKKAKYCSGKHSEVKCAKNRENKLYKLKDDVLDLLLAKGKAKIEGYHTQTFERHIEYLERSEEYELRLEELESIYGYVDRYDREELERQFPGEMKAEIIKNVSNLILIRFEEFTFHRPTNITNELKYLGEIGVISAEAKKMDIKFNQAQELLKRFLTIEK